MCFDDIVIAIFHILRSRNVTRIPADRKSLHKLFAQLKSQFPFQLEEITFRDKGNFPESSVLDQAIANLTGSSLIYRKNRHYELEPSIDDSFDRYVSNRLDSLEIIEQMANVFILNLNANS